MIKAVVIVGIVLAVLAVGTLAYFKHFVTPLDKEGMVYEARSEEAETGE